MNASDINPAYANLRKIYGYFSFQAPQAHFSHLINPSNRVSQLLQAHFVAMQLIMTPVTRNEWAGRDERRQHRDNEGTTVKWFRPLHQNVPKEWMVYYEWTMWVEREVWRGTIFNGVVDEEVNGGRSEPEEFGTCRQWRVWEDEGRDGA